jgi:hypothetical protein
MGKVASGGNSSEFNHIGRPLMKAMAIAKFLQFFKA